LWLHVLLFLLTVFTTLVIGASSRIIFYANQPAYALDEDFFPWTWALSEPSRLLAGIPFSFTLMSILFAHEMGHYIACLRYRVYATLPFFVPAPTLIERWSIHPHQVADTLAAGVVRHRDRRADRWICFGCSCDGGGIVAV